MEMDYNDFVKHTHATTYEANMKMADFAIQNNDFDGAINFYSKAIELQKDSVVANIQKLFLLLKLNRNQEAILVTKNLIQLEPEESNHIKTLAVCYSNINEHEKSILYFSKAIDQNQNDYNLFHFRGEAYFKLKKYYEAFFDFTKALEIKSDLVGVYIYRGKTRGQLNDFYGAIKDFTIVLDSFPNDSKVLYLVGITYLKINDVENGKNFLLKSAKLGNRQAIELLNIER